MARKSIYPPSVDPGLPELGPKPDGWSTTTFGNIFDVESRPIRLEPQRKYKLVVARRSRGGIDLRSELRGDEILTKSQFVVREGDFLISRRQIIHGACGIVPTSLDGAVVSGEYNALRTKPGYLMDFMRHYSHSRYFQRTCFHSSHGVDVEKMVFKLDDWLSRPVHMPPLPEQRKIAAILSSVDEAIEKTQAVIDQVQVVKKGLMQELLTRGLPGRHSKFKQTEIGEIPEEWEVARVGQVSIAITSGSRGWAKFYSEHGALFIRITNLIRRSIALDITNLKRVNLPENVREGQRTLLQEGDVLISITAELGLVAHVDRDLGEAYINQHIALVRPASCILGEFMARFFLTDIAQLQFSSRNDAGAKAGLNLPAIRAVLVPLPPLNEQEELCNAFRSLDLRQENEQDYLRALQILKQSLMSTLLTGELRVTP